MTPEDHDVVSPNATTMAYLVRHWWMMAVRGGLAILLGLSILLWPHVSLQMVAVLFGAYALIDGAWAVVAVMSTSGIRLEGWPVALEGLVSLAIGALVFGWPFVSPQFIALVAAWGVVLGGLQVVAALRLPRDT